MVGPLVIYHHILCPDGNPDKANGANQPHSPSKTMLYPHTSSPANKARTVTTLLVSG